MKLIHENFSLHETESKVKMTISNKLLEKLQKDGYAKNITANTPSTSMSIMREWKASVNIWNTSTSLIYIEDTLELKELIDSINKKFHWVENSEKVIVNKICDDLLSLKNSTWLELNEAPLTRAKFINNLSINSIEYFEDNNMTLWFHENGMFGGHLIEIGIRNNLTMETAEIAG